MGRKGNCIVGFYSCNRIHSVLGNLSSFNFKRNRATKKPIVVSEITWPLHPPLDRAVVWPFVWIGVICATFRRDGRVVEGTPLLRERRVYSLTEGSNPSLSARIAILNQFAPVAQMDRVLGYEPRGRAFESLRAHQIKKGLFLKGNKPFHCYQKR